MMRPRISLTVLLITVTSQFFTEATSSNSGPNSEESTVSIITEPQPLYVQSGEPLELICRPNNDEDGSDLQWFVSGKLAQSFAGFEVDATMDDVNDVPLSILKKDVMSLNETAVYSCRPSGNQKLGYNLPVYVFDMSAEPVVLMENNQDIELQCHVASEEAILQPVLWYFGGKEIIADKVDDEESKYVIFEKNNTLLINRASEDDIGVYTCQMKLQNEQEFSVNVSLEAVPYVKKFDKSKNLVQGDPLVLECDVWGSPVPEVIWYKQAEEEGSQPEPLDISDERIKLAPYDDVENASLRIENLDDDDRAYYICNAINDHGTYNSTILVRVKDKLAALWPFLGICAEVTILCIIIFVYERRRNKKLEEEERQEEAGHLTNSNDHKGKDEVRHRK